MLLSPAFALIVGVVGAVGAIAGAAALKVGREIGPKLSAEDLLPAPPVGPDGKFQPPLPRFLFTKPEVLAGLRRK